MVRRNEGPRRAGTRVRLRSVTVAAAVCATALSAGPAVPGAHAADRPRPYETADDAKRVHGSASSADAPALGTGPATDRIGPGEEHFYALDLDARSDVHLSATALPAPGTRIDYRDGIEISLRTTDGDSCGSEKVTGTGQTAFPLTAYVARLTGADGNSSCRAAGPYLVRVVREDGDDRSRWPLELSVLREPALKGSIPAPHPGTENESDTDSPRPAPPSGTPRPVAGGSGFNDARAVGGGVWKDRLRPGETRWYRVPVDWGQRLNTAVELPNAARREDGAGRFVARGFRMNVYNPARGPLFSESFTSYDGDGGKTDHYSNPVRYENRFASANSATRLAGWYYVAVTAGPDLAGPFPQGVPVTLRIAVRGKPKPGPRYDGDARAAGIGVSDEDRETAAKRLTRAEADDAAAEAALLRTVGWSGVGTGTALLAVLAAWTLLSRRGGAAAVQPVAGPPGGTPGPGGFPPSP
ncbi:hypothetical protein [Streptomyces albus]|uniref:hypothetical protein n=1 Tax=Streptomyces albus TaxID=1888 RepID=UPI0006E14486|nr:hypothetical protein [Streptomyces albus]